MTARNRFLTSIAWLAITGCCLSSFADTQPPDSDVVTSAHKILADHCYTCHGAAKQEGELRLDLAAEALKGGDEGVVIQPGRASESLLIEYVSGKGDTVMPPKGARLTDAEVATLTVWVDGGAKWPTTLDPASSVDPRLEHWSFKPVLHVDPPAVHNRSWVRSEIDAFVLAKLEQEKIDPSPEADRRTLVRRLSFDLLGLPPTPQEVDSFLADSRPDAYERLVDRFLASPHFGERWGRHWLDRARYADSSGCVIDLRRPFAWRWRDWVIDAVNNDLPFDRFTVEQIAGDLLPQADAESRIATGFQENALTSHEAGVDLEAERVKTTLDRTVAVGTAWLGLTVGCAQCHSHKYDPISQRDFYSFYAFFENVEEHIIDAPPTVGVSNVDAAERKLLAVRDAYVAEPAEGQAAWEAGVAARPNPWKTAKELDAVSLRSSHHAMVHQLDDGTLFVDGRLPETDTYVVAFKSPVRKLTAIRIESLTNPDRFDQGPGRGVDQQAMLTGITVDVGSSDKSVPTAKAEIAAAVADYCQVGFTAGDATRCGETKGWSLDQVGVPHAAVFVLREPVEIGAGGRIIVRLEQYSGRGHSMTRFRVSVADGATDEVSGPPVPDEISDVIRRPSSSRSTDEQAVLKQYYQSVFHAQASDLAAWNAARGDFVKSYSGCAAQTVRDRTTPCDTFVHLRGDFRRPGDKVSPGLLPALCKSSQPDRRLTRLDLAQWLVSPSNPLTARVAANDIWQHLFGIGLVDTPGDFGLQGDPPSHPELLDWLASEYVRCGWSRKAMIRRIVCSAAYRQSSAARGDISERDPKNRWLARQNRFRLEAESMRDTVLACSGLLDTRIGGPGFCVALSPDDAPEDWDPNKAPQAPLDIYRRGMYVIAKRTDPDAMLSALDAPDGTVSCPLRRRTNTPIQSLAFLNDPVFVDASRAMAKPADHVAPGDYDAWISSLFARCTSREPTAAEQNTLTELFHKVTLEYRDHPQEAAKLAQVEPDVPNAAEIAAALVVARSILNLDEVVTRE